MYYKKKKKKILGCTKKRIREINPETEVFCILEKHKYSSHSTHVVFHWNKCLISRQWHQRNQNCHFKLKGCKFTPNQILGSHPFGEVPTLFLPLSRFCFWINFWTESLIFYDFWLQKSMKEKLRNIGMSFTNTTKTRLVFLTLKFVLYLWLC